MTDLNKCDNGIWELVSKDKSFNSLNWERVAMSHDGSIQSAIVFGGNIYNSRDFGKTWIPVKQNFNLLWFYISLSANGKIQTAVAQKEGLYTSYDFGKTWIKNKSLSNNISWNSVCISEDGKYQTAVANGYETNNINGYIYVSNDYGKTWKIKYPYNNCWTNVAMSNSGKIQIAVSFLIYNVVNPYNILGCVFNSYDYGETWIKNESLPPSYYAGVAMNSSGSIQVVAENNCNLGPNNTEGPSIPGNILISYEYGKNFIKCVDILDIWLNVSINDSGNRIIVSSYQQVFNNEIIPNTGKMIESCDYGKTWFRTNSILTTWTSAIVSKLSTTYTGTSWDSGMFRINKI